MPPFGIGDYDLDFNTNIGDEELLKNVKELNLNFIFLDMFMKDMEYKKLRKRLL